MDEEEEKSFCYIEGTAIDKAAAEEVSELHENVWYRMRPPKPSIVQHSPFVSARQLDLVRNMLLGKTALKTVEIKPECLREVPIPKPLPRRDDEIGPPCLKQKKSSVRFLNESVFE